MGFNKNEKKGQAGFKLLAGNTCIYAIGNMGLRAASFFLLPIYTRLLSQSDFGRLAILLSTIQILVIFMSGGIRESLVRFTGVDECADRLGKLIGSSIILILISAAISTGCVFLLFIPLFRALLHCEDVYLYLALTCLTAMSQSLCTLLMTYYRSANTAKFYMGWGITSALLVLGISYVLLSFFSMGIRGALIAQAAVYSIVFVGVACHILPKSGFGFSRDMVKRTSRYGTPLIFAQTAWYVMECTPVYFISHYCGLESTATYSLGYKLAGIINIILVNPFDQAFAPYVFAKLDDPAIKKMISSVITYFFFSFAVVTLGVMVVSRFLIMLAAPINYTSDTLVIFLLLLPLSLFNGIQVVGRTLLLAKSKSQATASVSICCATVAIISSYLLVPRYGQYGAILTVFAAIGINGITVFFLGQKFFPVPIECKRILIAMLIILALFGGFFVLKETSTSVFYVVTLMNAILLGVIFWHGNLLNNEEKFFLINLPKRFKIVVNE